MEENPVKNAQAEVEALIQQYARRLSLAVEEQKLCTAELDKWKDVAYKLATVANISTQPANERKSLKATMPLFNTGRVSPGSWKEFWINNLTEPMVTEKAIQMGMNRMNADRNKTLCALNRWIAEGLIFENLGQVALKSYLEKSK